MSDDMTEVGVDGIEQLAAINEELEAKLAKAVEALANVITRIPDYADTVWIDAEDTLAELKGEKDE
jgi:hypothetical protein